jgi:hypothetical protein
LRFVEALACGKAGGDDDCGGTKGERDCGKDVGGAATGKTDDGGRTSTPSRCLRRWLPPFFRSSLSRSEEGRETRVPTKVEGRR